MLVMTFGASCSPSCAQYVKNLNADRFKENFPEATDVIQNNHYVDDWLQSVDSVEQAIQLAEKVKYVHSQGGFEIRNWTSNNIQVTEALNGTTSSTEKNMEIASQCEADKILRMYWRTAQDMFIYNLKINDSNRSILEAEKVPTKRELLRILMSIFDPLGLIVNILIYPKILLQQIWRTKTDWDEEISQELWQKWTIWTDNLHQISNIAIPRWIGLRSTGSNIEMHTFVDASEDAYAAVVYFKVEVNNEIRVSLITAKSRVAPLKGLTVPRMELQAAVLGTRLATFATQSLSTNHKVTSRFYWSDSETVIKWLNSDTRKYKQYV